MSGRVEVGQTLEIAGSGKAVRVRGIQAYGRAQEAGRARERQQVDPGVGREPRHGVHPARGVARTAATPRW